MNKVLSKPAQPQVVLDPASHGRWLLQRGRHADAGRLLAEALARRPVDVQMLYDAGLAALRGGSAAHALDYARRALSAGPPVAPALHVAGVAARRLRRPDESFAFLRAAAILDPGWIDPWHTLGVAAADQQRGAAARLSFRRGLRVAPGDPEILVALARSQLNDKDVAGARVSARHAIERHPVNSGAHVVAAMAAYEGGDLAAATRHYRCAIVLAPGNSENLGSFGAVQVRNGDMARAERTYQRAIALHPANGGARYNYGNLLRRTRRAQASIAQYDVGVAAEPSNPTMRYNRALALFRIGDFGRGFEEYRWRWRTPVFPKRVRNYSQPLWDGGPLGEKRLLVHAEQGNGDNIQFCRYLPLIVPFGGQISFECYTAVLRLFGASLPSSIALFERDVAPIPPFDVWIPLLDIPALLGTTLENVPASIPYLRAPADARSLLPHRSTGRKRVGLIWAGNPEQAANAQRSIGLEALLPILDLPDIEFVAIQKGPYEADIERLGLGGRLPNLGAQFRDFGDTAATMNELDLVISVCTSTCHLAGALGRPVWTLLHYDADWRWIEARDDTPWYPTMRLFHQERPGDWGGVVERVRAALRIFARG
jgi:Tfp pilus assembly protein PilF